MLPHQKQELLDDGTSPLHYDEFLTPEQRLDAVAEILAGIADRVVKKRRQRQE